MGVVAVPTYGSSRGALGIPGREMVGEPGSGEYRKHIYLKWNWQTQSWDDWRPKRRRQRKLITKENQNVMMELLAVTKGHNSQLANVIVAKALD